LKTKNIAVKLFHNLFRRQMKDVLNYVKRKKLLDRPINALEVFGRDGQWVTRDYANAVDSLEIWELNPEFEKDLKNNFPQATIKITDSYKEMKITPNKFDFVVVDNPMGIYGQYCEHFQLFPDIYRILKERAVLILDVIPNMDEESKHAYPTLFNEAHLEYRRVFYKTNHPKDIPMNEMITIYRRMSEENGFEIIDYYYKKRSFVYFLVLTVSKKKGG
jgi:hypothetical protein